MNKLKNSFSAIIIVGAMMLLLFQCTSQLPLVRVMTHLPDEITNTSAVFRGQVTVQNDSVKVEKLGVCWGKKNHPTINDDHYAITDLSIPYFVRTISDLEEDEIYHVRAYALGDMGVVYGAEYVFKTSSPNDFVDFGLPSGTLWSTRNLGAKLPEQSGSYLAWGESSPKYSYNWSTYKHCQIQKGSSNNEAKLKKYNTNAQYGAVDNRKELTAVDDMVKAFWGHEWCMPTLKQWRELFQYTKQEEVYQNGVRGKLFTRNGKSIFLPYTGYRADNDILKINVYGCYWTNQLDETHPDHAKCVNVVTGAQNKVYGTTNKPDVINLEDSSLRYYGLPVRPVRSPKQ